MKVWVVQGIWHDRRDISSGDANTKIVKILKHKPSTPDAQEMLDAACHNPTHCKDYKLDDPTFNCSRCWPKPKVEVTEKLDDNDEFGHDGLDHGWILEVVETELEDA